MSILPNATQYPANRPQSEDRRYVAQRLISQVSNFSDELFENQDLKPFLNILSKFHSYDYRNLLLILNQYPHATLLGPFKSWQCLVQDPSVQILKEEWKGRGLDLLIPYTVEEDQRPRLIWYAVKQFDISQTNVPEAPEQWTPYIMDELHISYLVSAMQSLLSYLFKRTLILVSPTSPALAPVLPYNITDKAVIMRSNTTSLERLQNLTDVVSRLSAVKNALPSHCLGLYAQCVSYCLFSIWGLSEEYPAPMVGTQVSSIPKDLRMSFLDMLQRTVRMLEECAACEYLQFRKSESDVDQVEDLFLDLAQLTQRDIEP